MKIKKVMNSKVESCGNDTDLATAARIMAGYDCGALPVLHSGKVVGMITDRDICVALAVNGQSASSTTVDKIMAIEVYHCSPEDSLKSALRTMRRKRVRRLPVINGDGGLEGILSITDVALNAGRAGRKRRRRSSYKSVLRAYLGISRRRTSSQETGGAQKSAVGGQAR